MNLKIILQSALLCILPISELRGGLPFALYEGLPLIPSFFLCTALNALVGPVVFLFLSSLNRLFLRWDFYKNIFNKFVVKTRFKLEKKVKKYGYWGIVLFVGIPLPITGAYTGALGAWVLGMEPKKVFISITVGVLMSGIIVSLVYYMATILGVEAFENLYKIFIKS